MRILSRTLFSEWHSGHRLVQESESSVLVPCRCCGRADKARPQDGPADAAAVCEALLEAAREGAVADESERGAAHGSPARARRHHARLRIVHVRQHDEQVRFSSIYSSHSPDPLSHSVVRRLFKGRGNSLIGLEDTLILLRRKSSVRWQPLCQ